MSAADPQTFDRLLDLLADEATEGLSAQDVDELGRLEALHPEVDRFALGMTAAALDEHLSVRTPEPLPSDLRQRIETDAARFFARGSSLRESGSEPSSVAPGRRAPRPRASRSAWWVPAAVSGWAAAAAVCVLLWQGGGFAPEPAAPPAASALRASFLDQAQDIVTLTWTATGDASGPSASGDIVWSPARQQGYMRFRGLAANDPSTQQYQLWIFDAARDERHPVDGGVFDITPGVEEVVVPIRARLPISEALLFAVTVEKPGGVVVSTRERLPLLAKAEL